MPQWWPTSIQERESHLYYEECCDTYIFRSRESGNYFVVGDLDTLGIKVILQYADIVRYTSQRLRYIDTSGIKGWPY